MMHMAEQIFAKAPVIPVITIDDLDTAVDLCRALVDGGLPVLEVTLRTDLGLAAIPLIKAAIPSAIVGAGTVLNPQDLDRALTAGSEFVITPGLTPALLQAGSRCGVPFMPGVASVRELMCCLDDGLTALKFFPAEANGGAKTLKAFAGPFPEVAFCPTGGVGPDNLAEYLAVPSVKTVGGRWVTPRKVVAQQDWSTVSRLAREACEQVDRLRKQQ